LNAWTLKLLSARLARRVDGALPHKTKTPSGTPPRKNVSGYFPDGLAGNNALKNFGMSVCSNLVRGNDARLKTAEFHL